VAQATLSPLEAWRQNSGGVGVDATAAIRYMSADASRFAFDFRSPPAVEQNLYVVNFSGAASTLQPICPALDNACLSGTSDYMTISADGSAVLLQSTYPFTVGGGSGLSNLYLYNVATAASTLVNVTAGGAPANASVEPLSDIALSDDGHLVAFSSDLATNFPGNTSDTLLLKNLTSGAVTLISATSDGTPVPIGYGIALPQLSADGNRLAFTAENQLIPHDYQVGDDAVVADLSLGRLGSACISASGSFAGLGCDGVTISADGRWAALRSTANNLVPNDTNGEPDIFVVALDPVMDVLLADGFEH
jgi:Tol biopolymer transport system component